MFRRMLVPLDGSELAEVALPYAEKLAGKLGAEITLIHVREPADSQYHHMHQFYIDRMTELTRQGAESYLDLPKEGAIAVNSLMPVGHPAEHIVEYAEKEDIDLVVMATHGWSGIRRWVLGGVAEKVLRATSRPVALIRAKGARADVREGSLLDKALIPLDGSGEGEAVVPYVEGLASRLGAEVVLLHVIPPAAPVYAIPGQTFQFPHSQADVELAKAGAEAYLEGVGARLKDKGIAVTTVVRVGNVADEVIKVTDETGADLVAMSSHGMSGVGRWAFGSTADKVLRAGSTPVLLARSSGAGTERHDAGLGD